MEMLVLFSSRKSSHTTKGKAGSMTMLLWCLIGQETNQNATENLLGFPLQPRSDPGWSSPCLIDALYNAKESLWVIRHHCWQTDGFVLPHSTNFNYTPLVDTHMQHTTRKGWSCRARSLALAWVGQGQWQMVGVPEVVLWSWPVQLGGP